jgi:hypothetical protein
MYIFKTFFVEIYKQTKKLGFFSNKKLPIVNDHLVGEN